MISYRTSTSLIIYHIEVHILVRYHIEPHCICLLRSEILYEHIQRQLDTLAMSHLTPSVIGPAKLKRALPENVNETYK